MAFLLAKEICWRPLNIARARRRSGVGNEKLKQSKVGKNGADICLVPQVLGACGRAWVGRLDACS